MIQRYFAAFTVLAFLFLIVFSIPSLIASEENSNKPSFKSSIPQSTIQNLSSTSTGDPKLDSAEFAQKTKKLQIPFIANNGQVDDRVRFYANTFGGTVFVTKEGEIVYALPNNSSDVETQCLASSMHSPNGIHNAKCKIQNTRYTIHSNITNRLSCILHHESNIPYCNNCLLACLAKHTGRDTQGVAIKEMLVGGRAQEITGNEKAVTKVCYFKGNDTSQWKTNISTYEAVSLGEVYDGIELKLKAYGNNVEKLFCVKPDANPDQIQVKLSGAKGLRVNDEGQLVAETELGTVKFTKPIAYQEINGKRVDISVEYRIQKLELNPKSAIQNLSSTSIGDPKSKIANHKLEYGFTVASYDKTSDLIIDPLLASTYLGGSSDDWVNSLALDTSGNVYVAGYTASTDFPTMSGAYDTSYNGGSDVFVFKLDVGLTSLLASTYLGGSSGDYGYSLALDVSGNVYVTGNTYSKDFPTTIGTYDTSDNNSNYNYNDVFVSKLDSALTSLLASTYLGGSNNDSIPSFSLDSSGNVYVTGQTQSTNFPTTSGAYDTSYNGGYGYSYDVFVSKLNSGLTSLLASTYLGGSEEDDEGRSLALDTSGNVYVTGWTYTTDFPTTSGAYDTSSNGKSDVFVSKLDGELTTLLASTYLGGSSYDGSYSLALDSSGNVYVTGYTESSGFPTTSGAYDTSYNGRGTDNGDVFVSKLNGKLTSLLASTYLGGSSGDSGNSLALDSSGNVYVLEYTESTDFPTTSGAYDTSFNGDYDVFVSKLDSGLTSLLAATYLGGSSGDSSNSIALDTSGNVYVPGYTESTDFPTTSGAYDTSYNGNGDVFVSKLDSNLSASTTSTPIPTPPPLPTPVPSPSLSKYGQISGYVYDMKGNPVESVKIRLKRPNSRVLKKTFSDEDGFFEFTDLYADTYIITAIKKGYKIAKQAITLEEGEEVDIEIVMKKANKRRIKMIDH